MVRDPTLTLTYFGARYYDVGIGQFTGADTLQTDPNRYAYAGNNPETNVDPDGHCWRLCTSHPRLFAITAPPAYRNREGYGIVSRPS